MGFALKENKFDGLYVRRRKGKDLTYAGKGRQRLRQNLSPDLQARPKPLIRKTRPCAKKIAHRAIWVEPSLPAEGKLRHPPVKGIREDLDR